MVSIRQLFLLNILLLASFVPTSSRAITEKTANILTVMAGSGGAILGGVAVYDHLCKLVLIHGQKSTKPLVKRVAVVYGGAIAGAIVGGGLVYWLTKDFRPSARYNEADELIQQLQKEPLILALQYHDYVQAVQRLYVRNQYPLLDAWKKLCSYLDVVLSVKLLLEAAAKDVLPYTYAYNQVYDLLELASALEIQINDRLFVIKQDPDYREQSKICREYDLAQAQLAVQQAKAQAALSKSIAEHESNKIRLKELRNSNKD